jgi:hypothetical protein
MRRMLRATVLGGAVSLLIASTALASDCANASKQPAAGAQVVINVQTNEIVWISEGLATRLENGIVDPATGEGLHGLVGFDLNGDGTADLTTWFGIGPDRTALPWQARAFGPACQGVTDLETFFTECLGG